MLKEMLFTIPADKHSAEEIRAALEAHPEIRFVSLAAADIYGNDTDEKIPVRVMMKDIDKFLAEGQQTDGSSVLLPKIADISDAKVDLMPDRTVNWYVDYNFSNIDDETGLPVGSLRIPAFLKHNNTRDVGSRIILRDAIEVFKSELLRMLRENPYVFDYLPFDSADDIDELLLTSATEIEFYVKTPHDVADKDRLQVSQELKEQYWKRTLGPVRTALERTLQLLDCYGLNIEMGHKEVGGVKPELHKGGYEHIMEQLEIDFRYADALQAADNDYFVRYMIKDAFRRHGLDVTFMSKPVEGVAGSGKHTHFGVAAKLKDGRTVNLFTALDPSKDYLSPLGYGALMGILKNYEVISPLANCRNNAFQRLKPGFEAPVSICTALGHSVEKPSRNRTVLLGLIRDINSPLATRFEMRAPNPKSNTYLVLAAGYLAMLDGLEAALKAKKTPDELCASVSKAYGEEDFYLEKDRVYRAENNIFEDYTQEDREKLFGKCPATVWENLRSFREYPEKLQVLLRGNAFAPIDLESFEASVVEQWSFSLRDRLVPQMAERVHELKKVHDSNNCKQLDETRWNEINALRKDLCQDGLHHKCFLSLLEDALDAGDFNTASDMQVAAQESIEKLEKLYARYRKNILD
ncbi:MAG: glutamine synthetase [Clostridia bacterium]|nr:glutamine synthetase [Clostridia bacterium]